MQILRGAGKRPFLGGNLGTPLSVAALECLAFPPDDPPYQVTAGPRQLGPLQAATLVTFAHLSRRVDVVLRPAQVLTTALLVVSWRLLSASAPLFRTVIQGEPCRALSCLNPQSLRLNIGGRCISLEIVFNHFPDFYRCLKRIGFFKRAS